MIKRSRGERIYGVFNGMVLLLVALVTLYPFLYVVFASVSEPLKLLTRQGLPGMRTKRCLPTAPFTQGT